ncbi:MAG: hypothetical protein AAF804_15910, partial [Bacteroidota bacterium]
MSKFSVALLLSALMSLFFGEPETPPESTKEPPVVLKEAEPQLPLDTLEVTVPEEDTSKVRKNPTNRIGDATHVDYVSPFYFGGLPSNYQTNYQLRDDLSGFDIYEKVGKVDVRRPSTIGYDDFLKYRRKKEAEEYFRDKSLATNEELEKD